MLTLADAVIIAMGITLGQIGYFMFGILIGDKLVDIQDQGEDKDE